MSYSEIFFLALALSVDAFVLSFSYGVCFDKNRLKNALSLASSTGLFQGLMPCIGYFLTQFVKTFISPYSKLIIFVIFVFLGIKFIKESFEKDRAPKCIDLACLILAGIATSIDAFSAGISLSLYGNKILKPALLIGLITFINSNTGFFIGAKLRKLQPQKLEILAGIILILLGIKAVL